MTRAVENPVKAPGLAIAGDGNDLVAGAVGGPITAAEGSFDQTMDIQTETSVTSPTQAAPGAYALQINVQPFTTPACANARNPKICQGWFQFLFMNDNNGSLALMEVWLFNFGSACPGQGSVPQLHGMPAGISWVHSGTDCVFDSPTTALLAAQPITSLGQLRMRAEAVPGGQDSVTISFPNGTISGVAISDQVLALSSAWKEAEFNVFGYVNGQRATFNSGAAAIVHIDVENGTTNAPTIVKTGFTGETNTLDLVPPGCSNSGDPPSIVFEETSLSSQNSAACPPKIPAPPTPASTPASIPCNQLLSDIEVLEKKIEQEAAHPPPCPSGIVSICAQQLRNDEATLAALRNAYARCHS